MPAIAVLLDGRGSLTTLRRSLPRAGSGLRLVPCKSREDLDSVLQARLIEAIVLGPRVAAESVDPATLRARYPTVPVAVFGRVRSEDAESILTWHRAEVALILIEGVDDAVSGELLLRHSASHRRLGHLADFPRLLRLSDRLQLLAWERLAASRGRPLRTAALARALGVSREHLSRRFGAGGAPNLKRVTDLLTVHTALELLSNPGYPLSLVARLLDLAGPSHLRTMVRRVTGLSVDEARALIPRELVRRFLRRSAA